MTFSSRLEVLLQRRAEAKAKAEALAAEKGTTVRSGRKKSEYQKRRHQRKYQREWTRRKRRELRKAKREAAKQAEIQRKAAKKAAVAAKKAKKLARLELLKKYDRDVYEKELQKELRKTQTGQFAAGYRVGFEDGKRFVKEGGQQ